MVHQVDDHRAVGPPLVGLGNRVDPVAVLRGVCKVGGRLQQRLRLVLVVDVVEVVEVVADGEVAVPGLGGGEG